MKLEVNEYGLTIVPQNPQDIAYLKDTLGCDLQKGIVPIVEIRKVVGFQQIAHIVLKRSDVYKTCRECGARFYNRTKRAEFCTDRCKNRYFSRRHREKARGECEPESSPS